MKEKISGICAKTRSLLSGKTAKYALGVLLLTAGVPVMADTVGDYTAGTTALTTVAEEIAKYVPIAVKLCYAIAGVVAIVGAISVYIAMNGEYIYYF